MYRNERYYENVEKKIYQGVGKYGIPTIEPTQFDGKTEFLAFNYAKSSKKPKGKGVHFFIDDYQFTRVWERPNRYLQLLLQFDYVMSPDFSTYVDFPQALQIYNHYRKHWLAAYWQDHGIRVIPTISWSDPESYEWCFSGEPVGAAVAVSAIGTQINKTAQQLFQSGYEEMIRRLNPEVIIFYGDVPSTCKGNIIHIEPFQHRFNVAKLEGSER